MYLWAVRSFPEEAIPCEQGLSCNVSSPIFGADSMVRPPAPRSPVARAVSSGGRRELLALGKGKVIDKARCTPIPYPQESVCRCPVSCSRSWT